MAGFVKDVTPRDEAARHIAESLSFPWNMESETVPIEKASGRRLLTDLLSPSPYPPYARSLRDGYAVMSGDVSAASSGSPAFLNKAGDVLMGKTPSFGLGHGEAAAIPTGGALPRGADAVVMAEDTSLAGGWVEIRRGVQAGDNIINAGEEIALGDIVLRGGTLIDFRSISLLAAIGIKDVRVSKLRISVLSTGDEIVPVETPHVPPCGIRDVNGWVVCSLLARHGFPAEYRGILSDDPAFFEERVRGELDRCDVLILSGGSSVGTRDLCSSALEKLKAPGLLVRGINIVPGKPTLIAGELAEKKLVAALPGHPLSCVTVAYILLLPLLRALTGAGGEDRGHNVRLPLARDIAARTGPEEFVPCKLEKDGRVAAVPAKSGYIAALASAGGLIRIPEDKETLRAGEIVEVWLW